MQNFEGFADPCRGNQIYQEPEATDVYGNVASNSSSSYNHSMYSSNNGYSMGNDFNFQNMQQSSMMPEAQDFWERQNMEQYGNSSNSSIIPDEPNSRKRARLETSSEMPEFKKAIKFLKFQEDQWNMLYDINGQALQQLKVHVIADKGFIFSEFDDCFIKQKKNHFQISVHVEANDSLPPHHIFYNNNLAQIREFRLEFCGVKTENPSSEVCVNQFDKDRNSCPPGPLIFEIKERRVTKVTVPRLHFSETTLNNDRRANRPNRNQKYFLLVVRLFANIDDDVSILIQSYASEKVIRGKLKTVDVPDKDAQLSNQIQWQKNGSNTLFTRGQVSVGTDESYAQLTVNGSIFLSGRIIGPSDEKFKEGIKDKSPSEALENMLNVRVVDYMFKKEIAEKWGLTEEQRHRTGFIAQELARVLPDAVRDIGEYFTIDESRVFFETVLAFQELCRLTGDIDEKVEEMSKMVNEYSRRKKYASSLSLSSSKYSLDFKRDREIRSDEKEDNAPTRSPKFIQVIIALMAICLFSMTSLYLLDWYNGPNHWNHSVLPPKGEPANLVISPLQYMPSYQPDAPPLLSHCFSPSCRTYCCGDNSTFGQSTVDGVKKSDENRTIGRARGSLKTIPINTGVSISIPMLNITLDQRYCVKKSCNKRRGNFNLFVPVSRFMPDSPVEIRIDVPKQKLINNCGPLLNFNHEKCPWRGAQKSSLEFPTSYQILENTFELSVGSYTQSAYSFRVGFSTDACFEEGSNGSFEEYNLIFYRVCT